MGRLYCIVNSMVADGLATQGARVSATMLLALIFQDILVSASEG